MRKVNLNIVAAVCVLIMALSGPAGADIYHVDPNGSKDFTTIQAAIDDANDYDEIEVAPGTYNEAIDFNGKAVKLYSSGGTDVTTINGTGNYHVVKCISGEDVNTILGGFTITGGNANGSGSDGYGGGMYCENSSPTVTDCNFTGNEATHGGGMFNNNSSNPNLNDCDFINNHAWNFGGGMENNANSSPTVTNCTFNGMGNIVATHGGGMFNNSSSPTVVNCTFIDNKVDNNGGGMENFAGSSPTVTNCTFSSNVANNDSGGGMFNVGESQPTVTNCVFSSNSAGDEGGGMYNNNSSPMVTNCTFTGNEAYNCGGMRNYNASNPTVTNCIFWGDVADYNPEISIDCSPTITYCDIQGGWSGTGNIDANPLFFNLATGDLRLRACSPCVDAGSNTEVPEGVTTDLGGNPRFVDDRGVADTGAGTPPIVDMGAYERQASTLSNPVYNVTQDVNYCSIQAAIDESNEDDVIELGPGTYDPIDFHDVNITVYSTDGPSVTVIDAGGYGTAVTCKGGQGPSTVLEGFTITGGKAANGGGMYCENSSPTVTNCTFSSNSATAWGGGMYNYNSSPKVSNCTFSDNEATHGGGMFNNYNSDPNLTDCAFINNHAWNFGGGMENNDNSNPTVKNCTFFGHLATHGGGIFNNESSPTVVNCTFIYNLADYHGGGMENYVNSSPTVTNCVFSSNSADDEGGGMYNNNSSPMVTNCTFTRNEAHNCGGMRNYNASNPTVTNCIFWGDSADHNPEISIDCSPTITYCDIQGGWSGTGNINADPLFVNAAGGYLRLVSYGSPCLDAGDNSVVTEPNDLAGNPRVVDGDEDGTATVDMGAYEYGEYRVHNVTQNASYITITGAIENGNNGDEIEVSPGTYPGSINFSGKAIRLYSSGGPDVTTIDGTGHYHVVQCVGGEDANTILEGFTITGGDANGPVWPDDKCGGGMYCESSSPTVTNCRFTANTAQRWGAGMFNNGCSPTVTDCIFTNNTALDASYGGGGMCNRTGGSPVVTNCTFSNNSGSTGGGMYNHTNCSPTVTNCIFIGNSAGDYGGGGMRNLISSSPVVANCTFTANTATTAGGAMYNEVSSPTVTNCILWGDEPNEIVDDPCSTSVVTYSDVQGVWPGTGNIDANPIFRNVNRGNLSLVPWSPCIDTGNNAVVAPDAIDITGQPRLVDGDCNTIVTVDMGAHELQHTYMSDFDSTCLVDWVDFAVLAWAWLAEPLSENWDPACDLGIPADRRIDILDLKVLAENWLDHADTSITCDAAVLNHVFGLDPVTIFDILGAAPCSFSAEEIIEEMKEGGCAMLELVEIDADELGQPVIPSGFDALGSYSFTTAGCQFAARELLPGTLASPLDYVQVCGTDYWKPVAPPGYVWLGLVESGVKPGLDDVKCVKEQLACPGTLGVKVDPEKPDDPNHIIPADTNGVYIGTFGLSNCPESLPLYVLDARVVEKPEYLTLQDIDQLIQDYGPILRLYLVEDYLPDDPQWVLDNGVRLEWALVENDSNYATFTQTYVDSMPTSSATLTDDVEYVLNSIKPNPPYDSNESFKYWLNIPDDLRQGNLSRAKSLVRVVPWNHFFTEIQFWFFYPFNGPTRVEICTWLTFFGWSNCTYEHALRVGRHYGDWEQVTLRFLNSSRELDSVYMSAHDKGHWFGAGDFGDELQFLYLHPIVYSGKYSHAQYSTTGDHYYFTDYGEEYGIDYRVRLYDKTGNGLLFGAYLADNYSVVSYNVHPVPEPDWLGFTARWGQYEKLKEHFCYGDTPFCNDRCDVGKGPYGPPEKPAWQIGISQEALTTE